jgi:hypothetical protein
VSRNAAIAVLLAASLLPIITAARVDHAMLGDDQLITLTYAKNIASGRGFVFNVGDQVLGTTTPLFALVMGGMMALAPGLPGTGLAVWLTALCWIGVIWSFFFFRDAFRISERQAALLGAVLAATGWVGFLGMESYPFALLLVVSAGLATSGHGFSAGLTTGLLFLTRGEGILLVGILLLAVWFSDRERATERPTRLIDWAPARLIMGFLIPMVAWSAYAMPTFGNIFPNTLSAKVAQVESGLWRPFHTYLFGEWLEGWTVSPWLGAVGVALFLILAGGGIVKIALVQRRLWVFPAWMFVYVLGYSALGVPGYPWYRLPVEFVLAALVGVGLDGLIGEAKVSADNGRLRRVGGWAVATTVLAALAWPTLGAAWNPTTTAKHRAYRELATWLDDHGASGESVAYHEVGYLGYYTELGVVDLVGLVSPEITERVASRDFSSGFWELRPAYLVYLEGSRFIAPIVGHPDFQAEYVQTTRLAGYDGMPLTVFSRRARSASAAM